MSSTTEQHPTPTTLSRLSVLKDSTPAQLDALSKQLKIETADKGSTILEQESSDPSLLFILSGSVSLEASDGAKREISHKDSAALSPLARLRPSKYNIVANTSLKYLRVDESLFDDTAQAFENNSSLILETYQVEEELGISSVEAENILTVQITKDLNSNQLLLPSMPDVAIQVGKAVNHDFADATRVAKVVENDPVIAAKVVKVANSARYSGNQTISRLSEAVTRIGLNSTHQLIMTFALREVFRCKSPLLKNRMQQVWDNSCQIAAIAHELAKHCKHLNTETALLAGLIHDIGSVTIISYACDFPELAEDSDMLDASIEKLHGALGSTILQKWKLPNSLNQIPNIASQWQYEHDEPCNYGDLILVAKQHVLNKQESELEVPLLEDLPAFQRLNFGGSHSMEALLEEASYALEATQALLNGASSRTG